MTVLKDLYQTKTKQELLKKFAYKNIMQVPKLDKIVINMGVAEAAKDKNSLDDCLNELTMLSAQKPLITKSKKAISNFKLRENQPIGMKVTLRGKRMYDFLYRFINIVSPRIRDFRGFKSKCDGRGNYSVGLEEQQMFPEINLDKVKRSQGMNISFITTANTDKECVALLKSLGMPYKKELEN